MALTIEEQIAAHIADLDNPHQTTKAQIGLDKVGNFGVASNAVAEAGTATDAYVTPAALRHVFNGILKREGLMDAAGNVQLL